MLTILFVLNGTCLMHYAISLWGYSGDPYEGTEFEDEKEELLERALLKQKKKYFLKRTLFFLLTTALCAAPLRYFTHSTYEVVVPYETYFLDTSNLNDINNFIYINCPNGSFHIFNPSNDKITFTKSNFEYTKIKVYKVYLKNYSNAKLKSLLTFNINREKYKRPKVKYDIQIYYTSFH